MLTNKNLIWENLLTATVVKLRNNADTGLVLGRKCKVGLPDRKLLWNNTCCFTATEPPSWRDAWAHKNLWPVHTDGSGCPSRALMPCFVLFTHSFTSRWSVFWWVDMIDMTADTGGSQTDQGSPMLDTTCIREHGWLNRSDLHESMKTFLFSFSGFTHQISVLGTSAKGNDTILRLHRHSETTGQLGRTGRSKQIGASEIDPLVASASSC